MPPRKDRAARLLLRAKAQGYRRHRLRRAQNSNKQGSPGGVLPRSGERRPENSRRGGFSWGPAGSRLSQLTARPEPLDCLPDCLGVRPRFIAEFALGLGGTEEHPVLRHAQAIDGQEWLPAGQMCHGFGSKGKWIHYGARKAQFWRPAPGPFGDFGEELGKHRVLAPENIVAANLAV